MDLVIRRLAIFFMLLLSTSAEALEHDFPSPNRGRTPSTEVLAARQNLVFPDGTGLPAGRGTVSEGDALFKTRCAACHGENGRGGTGGELAGGNPDLKASQPDKNIGTYWPYAPTLFDFVRRSMPLDAPWSLSNDQVYALVAYLLYANKLIEADTIISASNLPAIAMPNRRGFVPIDVDDSLE